ncbi:MAG: MBL fold metallo-hydrolase [Clostridiales bacterium]|nr:MBL fold metallo-hydrolase [Clostridiales bacterium]
MHRRCLAALFAVLVLVSSCAFAEDENSRKVFMAGECEPFAEGEELLTLYVCPLTGADAMLLTYGEHTMLVDTGKKTDFALLEQMLADAGLDHVDMIFNTHPHSDHIGGVIPLVESGFPIGKFMTLYPHDHTGNAIVQRSSIETLAEYGIPIEDMQDGDVIPFGDVKITVMRQEKKVSDNDLSAMLMVEYGSTRLLLTADVEYIGQWYLVRMHDLKADIMKYPHHAVSRMNPEFLEAVQPEFVFIPHGSRDTKNAQKQLNMAGVPFKYATWGPITIESNGEKWIVTQDVYTNLK